MTSQSGSWSAADENVSTSRSNRLPRSRRPLNTTNSRPIGMERRLSSSRSVSCGAAANQS